MQTPTNPPPSPQLFFDTVNAYQKTAVLEAAVKLDIFTGIAEGHATARALAPLRQASERGLRILLDALTVLGFLKKAGERYALTPDSAMFLDKHSPAYVGGALDFLLSPLLLRSFQNLDATVRKGGTSLEEHGTTAPEHPVWVDFARSMAPIMSLPAELLARLAGAAEGKPWKVLDIAAGHGLYGIAFARLNPEIVVHALDWPQVLEVARENAQKLGVADRFHTIPGSAFTADVGTGYDVILLPNFLHHFDAATCTSLMSKLEKSLAPQGRVLTLEFIPDENRISPPAPAMFSLTMLATTPSGDAFTFTDYVRMFQAAGFHKNELHELPPTAQRAMISSR